MLDEDLNPLLIEINQGPTLSISTAVTKDLVEQMLEDICKIVIDRQGQRDGEAGNFVKIFRQPYVSIYHETYELRSDGQSRTVDNIIFKVDSPKYQGNSLSIEGKGYKRPRAPMKRYVQTIKVNKKDENENDSDADGGGGDDDTEITKSYTWDVDRTRDPQTYRLDTGVDGSTEFCGSYERINRLAQPRARYREELAKRKSEPTNSIPTECRKAQPVNDQNFLSIWYRGRFFIFSNRFYFRQQFSRTHRTTIEYSMSQLNIKQQQSVVQINYSRLLPICLRAVTKKSQQNCQQNCQQL